MPFLCLLGLFLSDEAQVFLSLDFTSAICRRLQHKSKNTTMDIMFWNLTTFQKSLDSPRMRQYLVCEIKKKYYTILCLIQPSKCNWKAFNFDWWSLSAQNYFFLAKTGESPKTRIIVFEVQKEKKIRLSLLNILCKNH